MTAGSSTDEARPVLVGRLDSTPTGTQAVGIYDGATLLGHARVIGPTWTFAVGAPLAIGTHGLTAVVENEASGARAAASASFGFAVQSLGLTGVADTTGPITGNVLAGVLAPGALRVTDATTPVISGTLGTPLSSGETLVVYDTTAGVTGMLAATVPVVGGVWQLTPPAALAQGAHTITAQVESAAGEVRLSSSASFTVDAAVPSAIAVIASLTDDVGLQTGAIMAGSISDDLHPLIAGSLNGALAASQRVALYDGVSRLGEASVASGGVSFSFTPDTALSSGSHSLTAVVENIATGARGAVGGAFAFTAERLALTGVVDAVGVMKGNLLAPSATFTGEFSVDGVVRTDDASAIITGAVDLSGSQKLMVFDNAGAGADITGSVNSGGTFSYALSSAAVGSVHELRFEVQTSAGAAVLSSRVSVEITAHDQILDTIVRNPSTGETSVMLTGVTQTLDLSAVLASSHLPVDRIDLGAIASAGNLLRLGSADVLSADVGRYTAASGWIGLDASTKHQIVVDGTAGSSAFMTDGSWTSAGSVVHDNQLYMVYNNAASQVLIDADIARAGTII